KLKYVARFADWDALSQNAEQEGTTPDHVRWLFYVLQSLKLEQGTDEAAVPRLRRDDADTQKVFIPPRSEQQAIARYLDTETAKIDQLIQAKERLWELLDEKHHALITHAITRGLNPDVPMRDSGVYWIGKIPNPWQVLKLKRCIVSLDQGWSPKAAEPEPEDQKWSILKRNAVQGGQFDDSQAKAIPISPDIPKHLEIHPGDFLITRTNTRQLVGDVCYVQKTRPHLILSNLIYRLKLDESKLNGQFLSFFLQSQMGRLQIEADVKGPNSSKMKISQGHIRDWLLLVPPREEQNRIVDYIDTQLSKINALKAATQQTLELLNERRSSLITAVVNGQIQVQE
ncbi:MAG: restriction endonuclease subunit S, partial [Planktothrix sp.]